MDAATRVQILEEAICIAHNTNDYGKSINLTILPIAMGKK